LAAWEASVSRSRCSSPSRIVDNDVLQEAGAVRERADAEVDGDRLPEIRERPAGSDIRPRSNVGSGFSPGPYVGTAFRRPTGNQNGYVFARVIRARRTGIVAMICGHN